MPTLDINCTITAPSGTLDLNQEGVYKLEATAFGDRAVQQRKTTAKNPFVEGEFVVHSVKENITEVLAVYVYATTPLLLRQRVVALTDAFDQIQYSLVFRHGTTTSTYTCQTADYSIRQQHEYRHALLALVTAQVPRRPTVVYS